MNGEDAWIPKRMYHVGTLNTTEQKGAGWVWTQKVISHMQNTMRPQDKLSWYKYRNGYRFVVIYTDGKVQENWENDVLSRFSVCDLKLETREIIGHSMKCVFYLDCDYINRNSEGISWLNVFIVLISICLLGILCALGIIHLDPNEFVWGDSFWTFHSFR